MNTNHYFGHYAKNYTIVVDTASLTEQGIFIKGENCGALSYGTSKDWKAS